MSEVRSISNPFACSGDIYAGVPRIVPGKDAEVIVGALTSASPRVRYQITPDPMQQFMVNVLPKRMVDRTIAKRLGLSAPP